MPFNPLQYPLAYMPPQLVSAVSTWPGHTPFAFALVQMLRPKTIVELGTLQGDSYCAFCQAVAALKLPTRCWAVDSWENDGGEQSLAALRAVHDPQYATFSQLMRMTFDAAASHFAPGGIDLLHLDGSTDHAAAARDLQTWLPKLSDQSVLLLHNVSQLRQLWREITLGKPHFLFEQSGGLGIVAIGKTISASLGEFLNDANTTPQLIRAHFARLGDAVELLQHQKRLLQPLLKMQMDVNIWKQRAGQWVDPKTTDPRAAFGDAIGFTNNLAAQIQIALNDDLAVRHQLQIARQISARNEKLEVVATPANRSISVIICSIDDKKFSESRAMYTRLLQSKTYEIIRISDAKSMCEGYNRGIDQSTGDVLIFSHDDIEILNPNFADRLLKHLESFDLVGLAGTSRLCGNLWSAAGPPYTFGQVTHRTPGGGYSVNFFGGHGAIHGNIQAVDGLMFAVNRRVIQTVRFDESLDGFHFYDLDFSASVHAAGFRLGVANNIQSIHDSTGSYGAEWEIRAEKFRQKWASKLPPATSRAFQFLAIIVDTREEILEVTQMELH
jgi:glycosyltransferase involved in cell wall biosynthesis